jgi:hypothetical protein
MNGNGKFIGNGKLILITFTDENGKKFPNWVIDSKCQRYNVTIGKTYECSWIDDIYFIKKNDIGKGVAVAFRRDDFKEISEVRNEKINQIID